MKKIKEIKVINSLNYETSQPNRKKENKEGIGKYDIRDIHSLYQTKYKNFDKLVLCI